MKQLATHLLGTLAIALCSATPSFARTVSRQMLFMGEARGIRVYIDPRTIVRRRPFVLFWVYAVLPRPTSQRVYSLDTAMSIDCTIGSVRIYEIIRYDINGEVVSNSSFGRERPPDTLEILDVFDRKIYSTVCDLPKSAPL
ncbi:MAG: surface-adhesin E family protein [Pseudanabaenaceae cyanobacterium]